MANIVVLEKHSNLFHDVLEVTKSLHHSVTCTSNINEILNDKFDLDTYLLIIYASEYISPAKLLPKITKLHTHPKVLVVVDAPDIVELEIVLREGALDYILRSKATEYLKRLLSRPDGVPTEEEPAWSDVGERFNIYGSCSEIRKCLNKVAKASRSNISILIHGETGTGKELFARAIHGLSDRHDEQLVVIDCASLPASLVESILFGHSKGAFTGADTPSEGLVVRAHKGTLFLDEVSELPMELQKKFLRLLQERRFRPVGAKREVRSDFRLIAATNKDLAQMVTEGSFRADLLYRLQSLTLWLPPLRERSDDLVGLATHLLQKSCQKNGGLLKTLSKEFLEELHHHDWPGNIRELENVIDSAVTVSHNQTTMYPEHLPYYLRIKKARTLMEHEQHSACDNDELDLSNITMFNARQLPSYKQFRNDTLASVEMQYFKEVRNKSQGDVTKAMSIANLSRARLYEFYKKYNITKKSTSFDASN